MILEVIADACFSDVVHAEQAMLHRYPGLETGCPELPQAAFVATGRQQVSHAGAVVILPSTSVE